MSLPPRAPRVGDRIDSYLIEDPLGAGGMGAVYAATDERLRRRVAIKVMLDGAALAPEFAARFEREVALLARLDSPHVVRIFDHGVHGGWPYFVTQLAAGGDLGTALAARGPLPPSVATEVCAQVCEALAAAHALGIVHRDVKPANVLLRDDRLERPHVYLADFGIARAGDQRLTATGAMPGTWSYLSPEQIEGHGAGPASDVYAVGCLLWETLTGRPPYAGTGIQILTAHVQAPAPRLPGTDPFSTAANRLLAETMGKDPTARPAAAELALRLRGLLAPSAAQPARPSRRTTAWLAAGAAAVLVAGAGVGIALHRRGHRVDPPAPAAAHRTVTADIDGDGYGDALAMPRPGSSPSLTPVLLRSDGHRLAAAVPRPDLAGVSAFADVDGDGRLDPVALHRSAIATTAVRVLGRSSRPVLQLEHALNDRRWWSVLGDFDGDGRADVAEVDQGLFGGHGLRVSVVRSTADGWAATQDGWFVSRGGWSAKAIWLAAGDVDGDGRDDIALADVTHGVRLQVLLSSGRDFTATPQQSDSAVAAHAIVAGDFDGDGRSELAVVDDAGVPVEMWQETGDRWQHVRWHAPFASARGLDSLGASDIDGDGTDELVLVEDGTTQVARLSGPTPTVGAELGAEFDKRLVSMAGDVG